MSPAPVLAAGTLPWRREEGRLEVALVHRPKYDDWSWPKGKLDDGEGFPGAATRETYEETGLRVRLGLPLPGSHYVVTKGGTPADKEVRYWAAEVTGGHGRLLNEVDEVAWLDVRAAAARLTQPWDREQVGALALADRRGALTTWPLLVLRHADARPRGSHPAADHLRPLDARGRAQSWGLVPLLAAYGVTRLVSSPSTRAKDTLAPFADAAGVRLRLKAGLSEERHAEDPTRAPHHVRKLLRRGDPAALCSHGPVLPDVLRPLLERAGTAPAARRTLEDALCTGMAKGEALVVHVVGTGDAARVVATERHLPVEPA